MNLKRKSRKDQQRGVAMLIAMLAVVLLAIIGLGFMFMADTENSANNNYKDAERAYFASRAGVESVRSMLTFGSAFAGQAAALKMPTQGAPTGVIYVENSNGGAVDPTSGATLDTELCKEQFPQLQLGAGQQGAPCTATPSTNYFASVVNPGQVIDANSQSALLFPWVRVTNKQNYMGLLNQMVDGSNPASATPATMGLQVCWDGLTQYTIDPTTQTCGGTASPGTGGQMNPVWTLTSLALTPALGQKPGSRRMIQEEVAISPPLYVLPKGAVSAQAPISIKGKLTINAFDNCTCTSTGNSLPGAVCDKSKWAIYSGGLVTNQVPSDALTSGQGSGAAAIDSSAPWPYKIPQLINAFTQGVNPPAGLSCTGTPNPFAVPSVYADCGSMAGPSFGGYPTTLLPSPVFSPTGPGPQTTYIPGSVHLTGNTSGSGVLIIDGDLDVNGGLNFYGLILVRGKISFTGGGSQAVNLYGAILAGEEVNAQDQADGDSIGGSFNFQYDSCALKLPGKQQQGPATLLAEHETMF
jgi:hypothetical protein